MSSDKNMKIVYQILGVIIIIIVLAAIVSIINLK